MAVGPLEQAFVEITSDVSRLDDDLNTLLRRLEGLERAGRQIGDGIERAFEEAGEAIEDAFEEAARQADEALRDIGGPDTFGRLPEQAAQVGEDIEAAFREAARGSQEDLRDIGGIATFGDVAAGAEAAGERVESSFREASQGASEDIRDIGNAGQFAGLVVASEVAAERMEASFRDSSNDSIRAIGRLSAAGGSLSLLATGFGAIGLAAVAAGGATVGFGLQSAAALEQTTIGFTSLLGSAEAADAFIRELQHFAATTPFELAGLADNARQILAMGEAAGLTQQDVLPLLTTIGDLVAVLGQPPEAIDAIVRALSQMSSKGKVSTEELLQLAEAVPGFPVFQAMADGLGITTEALQEQLQQGAIPAQEGIDALIRGMAQFPGAAGAMAQQAQTLTGVFSTFKDTVSLALTQAFQPLVPAVKDSLLAAVPLIEDALGAIAPPLASLTQLLLGGLLRAVQVVGPPLGAFLDAFAEGLDQLAPAGAAILSLIGDALAELAPLFPQIARLLAPVVELFVQLVRTVGPPLIDLFGRLIEIITPLIDELAEMGLAFLNNLAPALEDLVPLLAQVADELAEGLLELLEELAPDIPAIAEAFGELALALAELLVALTPLIPPLTDLLVLILGIASAGDGAGQIRILTEVVQVLTPVVEFLARVLGFLIEKLLQIDDVARGLWNEVLAPFGGFLQETFGSIWERLGNLFGQVSDTVGGRLSEAFRFLKDDVLAPIGAFLGETFNPLWQELVRLWQDVLLPVSQNLAGALSNLWNNVLVPFGEFMQQVFNFAWARLGQILRDEIAPAVQGTDGALRGFWQGTVVPFAQTLQAYVLPILRELALMFFGPLLTAIASVAQQASLTWQLFTVFGGGLIGSFVPQLQAVIQGGLLPLQLAIAGVRSILQFLHGVAQAAAGFLGGAFSGAVNFARGAMDGLRSIIANVRGNLDHLRGVASTVASIIAGPFVAAASIARSVWGGLASIFREIASALGSIVGAASRAKSALGGVGDLAGAIGVPLSGFFEHGGIITRDMAAMLHAPEVVIPLNDPRRALQLTQQSGLFDVLDKAAGSRPTASSIRTPVASGSDVTVGPIQVIFQSTPTLAEARDTADALMDGIETRMRRSQLAFSVRSP